jgi:hypothetical protein
MTTLTVLLRRALDECRKRRTKMPEFQPLLSIEKQLEYLIELENGQRSDTQRMADLNLGLLAARELEPGDMELANLIYDVTAEVKEMKKQRGIQTR